MPYKNIEDRRAAWRRWKDNNISKHKENQLIQKQAVYHNPIRQSCSIKGCDVLGERHHPDYTKPKEIIWLCKTHHESLHHQEFKTCSIDGCERKHTAKGFCHPCYKAKRKKDGVPKNSA